MQKEVAEVVAVLQGSDVFTTHSYETLWTNIFGTLRQTRDSLIQKRASLIPKGLKEVHEAVQSIIGLFNGFLQKYEANYINHMRLEGFAIPFQGEGQASFVHAERNWPLQSAAKNDLLALREQLKAPVKHLFDFAGSGVVVEWREPPPPPVIADLPPAVTPLIPIFDDKGIRLSSTPRTADTGRESPRETSPAGGFTYRPDEFNVVEPDPIIAPRPVATPEVKTKAKTYPLVAVEGAAVFVNDDDAYQAWVTDHSGGYVINTSINKAQEVHPGYMPLHKATCRFISNFAAYEKGAFTERGFIKVCADDVDVLKAWTKAHGRADGSFTGKCQCLAR